MDEADEIDFDTLPITHLNAHRDGGVWIVTMRTSWQVITITHDGDFGGALEKAAQRIVDGESDDSGLGAVH